MLPVVALLAVLAAGCGGAAPSRTVHRGVPPALAGGWEKQASAIAAAASSGDDCGALKLANTLRAQVAAAQTQLPLRLRSALLTGVNDLAGRITCTPPPPVQPKPPPEHPKPPHDDHGHHGHHHGHGGRDGNDQ